jgi:iron-sulfur cluster protein
MAVGANAKPPVPTLPSPRAVANKSDTKRLLAAIRMALDIQSPAIRRNTQGFNRNRYIATAALPDYETLKDQARRIKENSIARLPELIAQIRTVLESRGGHVFLAPTAEEACRYIRDLCVHHSARLIVKGKSITSEEIHLNHVLEAAGIEVAESDLAEFILQVADEQPSHIIAPALHYSRERITALFKRKFETELPLETGEELTKFAREILRRKFLHADVGITGANLLAADTGTLMLVESEGNIRMSSLLPPVHIAIAGVEKIIPTRREMAVFLELLAASGTGQKLASYTSFLSPPLNDPVFAVPGKQLKAREFHLVLIDNGRMRMRDDAVFRETLYCIRCSACLNSCANFETVGGHAFGGETYSGGIGGPWEAGTGKLENARFSELCSGCSRCVNQCPVRIDVPWLNENLRHRLSEAEGSSPLAITLGNLCSVPEQDSRAPASKIFFGNYHWFAKWGSRVASLTNFLNRMGLVRFLLERSVGVDRRRALPPFARRTLVESASRRNTARLEPRQGVARAVLFADVFTNYGLPERGLATLRVLRAMNVDVVVSDSLPEGRAAVSQGLLASAAKYACKAAAYLEGFLRDKRDIVVVEPSSLAVFRRDGKHLFASEEQFERLRASTFEPVEYVARVLARSQRSPGEIFDISRSPVGKRLFFHSHCQQKTIGCAEQTEMLLRSLGFDVATSSVECCGMAGSFGYKKDFYEVSMAVGEDLFQQVRTAENGGEPRALVASGTSCTEQLRAGLHRKVIHPVELLSAILREPEAS